MARFGGKPSRAGWPFPDSRSNLIEIKSLPHVPYDIAGEWLTVPRPRVPAKDAALK
jgi:hypothetical protein